MLCIWHRTEHELKDVWAGIMRLQFQWEGVGNNGTIDFPTSVTHWPFVTGSVSCSSFSFSTCMHSCPSVFPCVVFLGVGHILDWYSQMFNSQHKVWSFAAFYCGQELSTCTGNYYLIDMLLWKLCDHNSIFFLNKYWFIHRQKTKWQ